MGESKSRYFLQLLDHGEENAVILMDLGKRTFPFVGSLYCLFPVLGAPGDCHESVKLTGLRRQRERACQNVLQTREIILSKQDAGSKHKIKAKFQRWQKPCGS